MAEKIITYSIDTGESDGMITEDIEEFIDILRKELINNLLLDDDEEITFTVTKQKCYTKEDIENLDEFSGF